MLKASCIILLLISYQGSFGTAQIPDRIVYEGDTFSLHNTPLDMYPGEGITNPYNLFESSGCFFTGCWRNYVATWMIENNRLYLTEIKNACYPTEMTGAGTAYKSEADSVGNEYADLMALFPDRYKNGRVLADWVNGELYAPYGDLLYYVHDGFRSIYENELQLNFEKGELLEVKEHDNSKTKKSIYNENYSLLWNFISSNIDPNMLLEADSIRHKVFVQIVSTNDIGAIDSVVVARGINEKYDQEAIRIIKLIPEWDVIYRHGQKVEKNWVITVDFSKK